MILPKESATFSSCRFNFFIAFLIPNSREVEVPDTTGKTFTLEFDRAMSNPVVYVTVRAVDKDGNFVPTDSREVKFTVKGAGRFRAAANGDPKSLRLFHEPVTDLFSGAATAIVRPATGREKYSSKQGQRDSLPHASLSPQSKGVCEFKSF